MMKLRNGIGWYRWYRCHALCMATIFLVLGAFLLTSTLGFAEEMTAGQLIQDADQFRGYPQSFEFVLEVTSIVPGKEDRTNRLSVYVRDEASLVKFEAPAHDKGKAMLFQDRDLWLHVPTTKRLIRISPIQRLLGQASNGDVAGTRFASDYHGGIIGTEILGEVPCYVMDLQAVDRKVTYARLKYWVSQKDHRPVKSEHYAVSGKLLKILHYEEFTESDEGLKLSKLLILDPLKKGHKTTMTYSHWKKADLAASMFQKTYLKRLK